MSASVWMIVLLLNGQGKAAAVLPFEYRTVEECVEAGKQMQGADRWAGLPDFVCVSGPSEAGGISLQSQEPTNGL